MYRKQFISFPDGPFFLRHVVMMNYAGKVYSVLRGIEVAVQSEAQLEQALFITYAVCMTLGMYNPFFFVLSTYERPAKDDTYELYHSRYDAIVLCLWKGRVCGRHRQLRFLRVQWYSLRRID